MVWVSAEYGFSKAQCCLGVFYVTGDSVVGDIAGVIGWFKKAVE